MTFTKLLLFMLLPASALAFDNGPRVVGCDYKLGNDFGTDKCLVTGSGMQMGTLWIAFRVKSKEYRYTSDAPKRLDQINKSGAVIQSYPIRNTQSQCRPGGANADRYQFQNGDFICLYE